MNTIQTVKSLWRCPVKNMRGEELDEMSAGFSAVYGDRLFAFRSSASPKAFFYLTGHEQCEMLRYRPPFRQFERAARPVNLTGADSISPGVTPYLCGRRRADVDVEALAGETVVIELPS